MSLSNDSDEPSSDAQGSWVPFRSLRVAVLTRSVHARSRSWLDAPHGQDEGASRERSRVAPVPGGCASFRWSATPVHPSLRSEADRAHPEGSGARIAVPLEWLRAGKGN